MEKILKIEKKNVSNKKKSCQKFEITNFKEKKLVLINKSFKLILILPTLNT